MITQLKCDDCFFQERITKLESDFYISYSQYNLVRISLRSLTYHFLEIKIFATSPQFSTPITSYSQEKGGILLHYPPMPLAIRVPPDYTLYQKDQTSNVWCYCDFLFSC